MDVTLTEKIKLTFPSDGQRKAAEQAFSAVTKRYAEACMYVSCYYFEHNCTGSAMDLQKTLYADVRASYGLKSQMAISVFKTVLARYKTIDELMKQETVTYAVDGGMTPSARALTGSRNPSYSGAHRRTWSVDVTGVLLQAWRWFPLIPSESESNVRTNAVLTAGCLTRHGNMAGQSWSSMTRTGTGICTSLLPRHSRIPEGVALRRSTAMTVV